MKNLSFQYLNLIFLLTVFQQDLVAQNNIISAVPPLQKYKVDAELNRDRSEDYLTYLLNQNDFFVEYSVFADHRIRNFFETYPEPVAAVRFENLTDARDIAVQAGFIHHTRSIVNFGMAVGYRQFQKRERLEIEAQDAIAIERDYQYRVPHVFVFGNLPIKRFQFYFGFRGALMQEYIVGDEYFTFTSREEFAQLFPEFDFVGSPNSSFRISRAPSFPYQRVDYLNLSLNWAISYKQDLGANLFLEVYLLNPILRGGGLTQRLTDIEETAEESWQEHYYPLPKARQLLSADYLSLRLGWTISSKSKITDLLDNR